MRRRETGFEPACEDDEGRFGGRGKARREEGSLDLHCVDRLRHER